MAKKKRKSQGWNDKQNSFPGGPQQGFQKKGTIGVRKGMR